MSEYVLTVTGKMDASTLEDLKGRLTEKFSVPAEIEVKRDDSILGGFVFNYDRFYYDCSVKTQLGRLRESLDNGVL